MLDDDAEETESCSYNGLNVTRYANIAAVREYETVKQSEGYVSPQDYDRLEKIKAMSEILDDILFWCWNVKHADGTFGKRGINSAKNHFVVLTALVKPDFLGGMTYEELGKRTSVTKQNLSVIAKNFEKEFGVKFRRSHREDSKHSEAAKKTWEKKRAK
jgi:hypothetical protein